MDKCVMETPVGRLMITEKDGGITRCDWTDQPAEEAGTPILQEAVKELKEYFRGERRVFTLPLAAEGTEFQKAVWQVIVSVPYGKTLSYSELAQKAGRPKSSRAAANACGANPISIIIPCHRIAAKNGGMGGYMGGLDKKKALWEIEGISL